MGSFVSCIATAATWCFCTAAMSLCNACCGNDKPSTVPPSATSGRKRSVLLLILMIALSFAFQYGLGPWIAFGVPVDNFVTDGWRNGCIDGFATEELQRVCVGNQGVYRVTGSALLFFLLAAIFAYCKPTANREAWPAKYILYVFLVAATCLIPNTPLFSDIYLQIGRIGAAIFVVLQQIIILDLAFNWNDSWVEKSNSAETEALGKRWLYAILASCALLFTLSLVGIGLLFANFGGCPANEAFISVTLVMSILLTVLQLSGEEGSLLASAVIVIYGVYLCYTSVSKNPNATCNPRLGTNDVLGIIFGVTVTLISLAWMGFSYTAESRIDGNSTSSEETTTSAPVVDNGSDDKAEEDRKVQGVVTGGGNYGSTADDEEQPTSPTTNATDDSHDNDDTPSKPSKPVSWKLNIVLAMIACWTSMALTGWGSIASGDGNAPANPEVSNVSFWMIIASQWLMYLLYGWALVAPRLFPDRDFS